MYHARFKRRLRYAQRRTGGMQYIKGTAYNQLLTDQVIPTQHNPLSALNQPVVGEELVLPSSRSVLMLSRNLFFSLVKNKTAIFDDYALAVKPLDGDKAFKLQDKIIDALYLESESGTSIWVLNNPTTPLILKIEGNPTKVNFEVTDIK